MPRTIVVSLLIVLNVIVYLLWLFAGDHSDFMQRNFLVSMNLLTEGRIWTLLLSEFSHMAFFHLFLNMYVLFNFGPLLELSLGSWRFLAFYLTAAVVASLSHSILSTFYLGHPEVPALGASGAVSGVLLLFGFIFPRQKLLLLGLIPMPAIFGAVLIVGIDLWGLYKQAHGAWLPIGHGAHLGGAFAGFLYFLFLRKRYRRV